jgi:hypothetical protein
MANLAKLLQVEMTLPEMAKRLAAAGRGKDSILAHINPKEAALLKSRGGRGRPNPETGIIEFDDAPPDDATSYAVEDPSQPVERDLSTPPPDAAAPVATPPTDAAAPYAGSTYGADYGVPIPEYATAALPGAQAPQSATANQAISTLGSFGIPGFNYVPQPIASDQPAAADQPAAQPQEKTFKQTLANAGTKLAAQLGQNPLGYLKVGGGLAAALSGRKAVGQVTQQAAVNEAEIRKLAEPYRQQGQQLMNLGQTGQLTAPQQQSMEAQRAAIQQQLAQAGVTGGTAQMQAEQSLSRLAQQYAQDNIKQGVALMGTADRYITDAIQAGYTGAKDAATLTRDFYSQIASMLPTTAGGPPK